MKSVDFDPSCPCFYFNCFERMWNSKIQIAEIANDLAVEILGTAFANREEEILQTIVQKYKLHFFRKTNPKRFIFRKQRFKLMLVSFFYFVPK